MRRLNISKKLVDISWSGVKFVNTWLDSFIAQKLLMAIPYYCVGYYFGNNILLHFRKTPQFIVAFKVLKQYVYSNGFSQFHSDLVHVKTLLQIMKCRFERFLSKTMLLLFPFIKIFLFFVDLKFFHLLFTPRNKHNLLWSHRAHSLFVNCMQQVIK